MMNYFAAPVPLSFSRGVGGEVSSALLLSSSLARPNESSGRMSLTSSFGNATEHLQKFIN